MPKTIRPLLVCLLGMALSFRLSAREGRALDVWTMGDDGGLGYETPVSVGAVAERGTSGIWMVPDFWEDAAEAWATSASGAWNVSESDVWSMSPSDVFARPKPVAPDTASHPKNTLSAKEWRKTLTFAQRNSGAFRTKKHGGVRSPGMAALCSAVIPGLGQCYNAQWYKPPVIYAGAAVIAYFVDFNLKEKRVYEKEVWARYEKDTLAFNPNLAGKSKDQLLALRNYHQQNFELTLIIAGAVYLLNIIDAVVYAYLFDFNVSPNLALEVEPYARPNLDPMKGSFPLDMGFRLCMTFK